MRRLLSLLVCLLVIMPVVLYAQQTRPTNQEILNTALQDAVKSYQGTCKVYVRTVMGRVGVSLSGGYRDCYLAVGTEVNGNDAIPGDIIQVSRESGNLDIDTYISGYHTAIVQKNNGDGTFDVIDSNWSNPFDYLLRHRPSWNPYSWAESHSLTAYFYRLGRVDGVAIGQLANGAINQKFVAMANEISTAYRIPLASITAYDNKGGAYVHQWEHFGTTYTVQDVLVRTAGLTHERALFILGHDGHTERVLIVKEGFYWLFMKHNTGIPTANETWSDDHTNIYQMFSETIARWYPETRVLRLISRSDNMIIAEYRDAALLTLAGDGDDTYALGIPAPAPDPVVALANVKLVIQPAELGYRYQLQRGQERMSFDLRLDHTGGNQPFIYRFYVDDVVVKGGPDPFMPISLTPGTHIVRARVEAGSGNTLQTQEVSQPITIEAAPKSDWGVPFEVKINTIAQAGGYIYIAGEYVTGSNTGKGFLRRIAAANPEQGESYTFGFTFNEILPRDSYLFAPTSGGLMVSRDQGVSWSTVFSNGEAYDIAILPGDKWNDWPILILVGCSGGTPVYYGFWTPSEPNNLSVVRTIGGFGPYTLVGGRISREEVRMSGSGQNGVQTRQGPYHLAYTNPGGQLGQLPNAYAGRAWAIFSSGPELWVAIKTNAGDNVYYNDDYGGSRYQKAIGIGPGDDVVAFAWIDGVAGPSSITRQGVLYHAPTNRTQWRAIAGFSQALGLDLAAGQLATNLLGVGQYVLIGTERGLRVMPASGIAALAAAKPVGAGEELASTDNLALLENYPNPFNPNTTIQFRLPEAQTVRLRIYAITGSLVAELAHETMPAGNHTAIWEASRYGNGVYFCVLEAGNQRIIRKLTLLK